MPTPKVLRSVFRTAIAALGAARPSSRGRTFNAHFGVLGLCLVALTGCSDSLTAPSGGIDRAAVARVMPAVTDARLRVTNGFGNVAIRQRVFVELSDLEIALRSGDAQRAQLLVRKVNNEVTDYRAQASISEGADMTAIFLMLQTVSEIVDAANPLPV